MFDQVFSLPHPIEAFRYPRSVRVFVAINGVVECEEDPLAAGALLVARWPVAPDSGEEEGVALAAPRAAVGEPLDHEGLLVEGVQLTGDAVVAPLRPLWAGAVGKLLVGESSNEPLLALSWLRVRERIVEGEVGYDVSEIDPEFAAPDGYPLQVVHAALSWHRESYVGLYKSTLAIVIRILFILIQYLRLHNGPQASGLPLH